MKKLRTALKEFLDSPYRGEWEQQVTVKLTAGELRLILAKLDIAQITDSFALTSLGSRGMLKFTDDE